MKSLPTLPLWALFANLLLPLGCGNSGNASSHDGSAPAVDAPSGTGGGSLGTGGTIVMSTGGTGAVVPGTGGRSGTGGSSAATGGTTVGTGGSSAGLDASVDASMVIDLASYDGGVDRSLTGDADSASVRDGPTSPPCPEAPPRDGDPCDATSRCYYEDCTGVGRTVATCTQGVWSVSVGACRTYVCQSGTVSTSCAAGTVCVAIASGFPVAQCASNSCGSGPISCDCLSSCVGACSVRGTAADGLVVDCSPSCPPGGCV
jgi:hypothetical protein